VTSGLLSRWPDHAPLLPPGARASTEHAASPSSPLGDSHRFALPTPGASATCLRWTGCSAGVIVKALLFACATTEPSSWLYHPGTGGVAGRFDAVVAKLVGSRCSSTKQDAAAVADLADVVAHPAQSLIGEHDHHQADQKEHHPQQAAAVLLHHLSVHAIQDRRRRLMRLSPARAAPT